MAKSKLHPLAKQLGFKSNEDFYKKYPTQQHYEMACGGAKYPEGGIVPPVPVGRNMTGDPSMQQFAAPGYNTDVNFMDPNWSGATTTPRGITAPVAPAPVNAGYQYQYQDPRIQQKMAQNRGFADTTSWLASGKDAAITAKINAYNTTNPVKKKGGSVFPQIQSEKGFFSMGFENVPAPYQNGSFHLGGSPGEVFHAAAPFPKNGREAYGRPTYGSKWIAQDGGIPNSGANYQWPIAPNAPVPGGMPIGTIPNYGGSYTINTSMSNQFMAPKDTTQQTPNKLEQFVGSKKKKGGPVDFNQGSKYFTNKMNDFTNHLRNTALSATEQEMMNQHMMPDGSMMSNDMMNYGGTPEMFPYAMPYQYANGGIHIDPSKRGTFTAAATKHGESVQGFASQVMANKGKYSPAMVKKANFARNAAGWRKQEGGEGDQTMQLIQEYAQKVGINPEELVQKLQQMSPEEQQQAIAQIEQELSGGPQGGMEEAQNGKEIKPYKSFNDEASYKAALYDEFKNYRGNYDQGNRYSDGYRGQERPIREGSNYNYPMGPNIGGFPFPMNGNGYTKYKNVYINGAPMGSPGRSAFTSGSSAGLPGGANLPENFRMTSAPRLLGRKYTWEYGPGTGKQSPKEGTIVGNKLRKMFGPKAKQSNEAAPEAPYQEVPGIMPTSLAPTDKKAWMKENAGRFQPPVPQNQAQDPDVQKWIDSQPPWVKSNLAGYEPGFGSSEVNPMTGEYMPPVNFGTGESPQMGYQPGPSAPTEVNYKDLQNNYANAVAERDRIFEENNINSRGRHRNILGIKYQVGGQYDLTGEEIQKLKDGGYDFEYI